MLVIALFALALTVLDGDTIVVGKEHIRIANIDAPELKHAQCDAERRLAIVARERLRVIVSSGRLEIARGDPATGRAKDRFGRTLAMLSVDGRDVGAILVAEQLARPWQGKRRPWCGQ